MASDGADGLLVALAPGNALVEAANVPARRAAAIEADRVRGLDERPF